MADQQPNSPAKGGARTSRVTQDDLYGALGRVQAGLDVREQEARQDRSQIVSEQQDLLAKRKQAEDANDVESFDDLTAQLDQLDERLRLINRDIGEDPDASVRQPEHEHAERDREQRGGDGNAPGDGAERPLADQERAGDDRGGNGDADDNVGEPDDRAASGGAGRGRRDQLA